MVGARLATMACGTNEGASAPKHVFEVRTPVRSVLTEPLSAAFVVDKQHLHGLSDRKRNSMGSTAFSRMAESGLLAFSNRGRRSAEQQGEYNEMASGY